MNPNCKPNAAIVMSTDGFEKGLIPTGEDALHRTQLLDGSKEVK